MPDIKQKTSSCLISFVIVILIQMLHSPCVYSSVWFPMTSQTWSENTKPTSVLSPDANWIHIPVKALSCHHLPLLKRGDKYLWDVRWWDFRDEMIINCSVWLARLHKVIVCHGFVYNEDWFSLLNFKHLLITLDTFVAWLCLSSAKLP